MTDKIKIVYIGETEEKKMSRGFTNYVFPRGVPVSVPEQLGYDFLKFKDTFATPEQAEKVIQDNAARKEAELQAAEAQRRSKALADAVDSYIVLVDGEQVDISKYIKSKLATVVVAEELPIDINNPEAKDGETPVEALRNRIREALHAKHGNPLLEEA